MTEVEIAPSNQQGRLLLALGATCLGLCLFLGGYCWGGQWSPSAGSTERLASSHAGRFSSETGTLQTSGDTLNLRARAVQREDDSQYGRPTLIGTVTNTTGEPLGYIEVQAQFTDAHGAIVATGKDARWNFDKGDTWRFEILWPEGAEASEVTGHIVKVVGRNQ